MVRVNAIKFLDDVNNIYITDAKKLENYVEYSRKENMKIHTDFDERRLAEISHEERNQKISEMLIATKNKVNDLYIQFAKNENEYFLLSGDNATADFELLNNSLITSKEDVDNLLSKYKDKNNTMFQAVNNYAKKNNILTSIIQQSKEERNSFITDFVKLTNGTYTTYCSALGQGDKVFFPLLPRLEFYKNNAIKSLTKYDK